MKHVSHKESKVIRKSPEEHSLRYRYFTIIIFNVTVIMIIFIF